MLVSLDYNIVSSLINDISRIFTSKYLISVYIRFNLNLLLFMVVNFISFLTNGKDL